jgi:hypothetical protein
MRFRKLRIAWSVGCIIVVLLLCTLWVRSYKWVEVQHGPFIGSWAIVLTSMPGVLGFEITDTSFKPSRREAAEWWTWSLSADDGRPPYRSRVLGYFDYYNQRLDVPCWFAVMLMIVASAAPWFPLRFSLRTLLIATTLIAVVLGTIVWMSQTV